MIRNILRKKFGIRYLSSEFINEAPVKEMKPLLKVSLVGRPNTGKSTLFNRLTRSKSAIISNIAGTTRDRKEGKGYIGDLPVHLVDTGGFDDRGAISNEIKNQVNAAIDESDIILFLVDSRTGITAVDQNFARWIRKKGLDSNPKGDSKRKKVVLVANKAEGSYMNDSILMTVAEGLELGFGDPLLLSATMGDGIPDLAISLFEEAERRGCRTSDENDSRKPTRLLSLEEKTIQMSIMGKPNVGKSTLFNAILGQDRVITGSTPGLTRDSIQVEWEFKDRKFRLVDTAGLTRLRTNSKLLSSTKDKNVEKKLEVLGTKIEVPVKLPGLSEFSPETDPSQFSFQISEFALISALNSLRYSQVVLLVVEGSQGKFSKLDLKLARKCLEEGRAVVIAANKSDELIEQGMSIKQYEQGVKEHASEFFREFGDIPVIACSGLHKKGLQRILNTVIEVNDAWSKRIDTWILNRWMKDLLVASPAPRHGLKRINVKYLTQIKTRPPTFALFSNVSELPPTFERFLVSRIQKDFSLGGIPIRFVVRKTIGNVVKKDLLRHGKKSRRGVGIGEYKGKVGPQRMGIVQKKELKKKVSERRKKLKRIGKLGKK